MKISEIEIIPIKSINGMIAIASLVLNNDFYLGCIGIHRKLDNSGYRLTYPTKRNLDKSFNIYHPINKNASRIVEEAIINKLNEVMKKENYENESETSA